MSLTDPLPDRFAAFCRRDLPRLVRHLRMSGYDQDLAEDAAQEAMIALLEVWGTGRVADPGAWVRCVAGRKAAAAVRRERRLRELHGQAALELELSVPADHGDEGAIGTTLRYLRVLPPMQRWVMAWLYDGYKSAEIAEHTGQTPATVRSHIRHARRSLRPLWEAENAETAGDTERAGNTGNAGHAGNAESKEADGR
ncbi:RNA polymerase sigma factor [Streptomyces sp. NPDC001606]